MINKHFSSKIPKHVTFIKKMNIRNENHSQKMYLMEEYTRAHDKLLFECEHGHSRKIAAYSVSHGTGCAKCSRKAKYTTNEFVEYLNNNTFWKLFKGEEYINSFTKLKVVCPKNHIRELAPSSIISQNLGCAICSRKAKKTTESFLQELNEKRIKGGMLPISISSDQHYTNANVRIEFECSAGHKWKTTPATILHQLSDCPSCTKRNYSKMAISWLNGISNIDHIYIQHAENKGEYKIPNTNYFADGYCKETNTVYEFHGDKFHGNLNKFKPSSNCHPFDKEITALELYEKTIRKEERIIALGYNLVTMWESDYK